MHDSYMIRGELGMGGSLTSLPFVFSYDRFINWWPVYKLRSVRNIHAACLRRAVSAAIPIDAPSCLLAPSIVICAYWSVSP